MDILFHSPPCQDISLAGKQRGLEKGSGTRSSLAFDSLAYRPAVEKAIPMLQRAGVNIRNKTNVYVYLHDDAAVEDALLRCEILRSLGALPYIMVNRNAPHTQRMTDLKRWTRPCIFFSTDFDGYRRGIGHVRAEDRTQSALDQWA